MFNIPVRLVGSLMCTAILALSVSAQAQSGSVEANREWVRTATQNQVNQGQLDKAIQILKDHLKVDKEDATAWAHLALIQKHLNRCEEAQTSLLSASNVGTSGQREIYLVAADQLRSKGCKPLSSEQLTLAKDQQSPQASKWSGSAKLLAGYDDNVLLVSDSETASASPESAFVTPTANVSFAQDLNGGLLNAQSVTSYTSYMAAEVRDLNSLSESIAVDFEPSKDNQSGWDQKYGNRFDIYFVDSDGLRFFSWVNMLKASFSKPLDEKSRWGFDVAAGYQQFSSDSAPTAADKRDGLLANPAVWYAQRIGQSVWTSGLSYSQAFASGDNYKSQGVTVSTGLSGAVYDSLRGRVNLAWTHNDYTQHVSGRKDDRAEASVGLSKNFVSLPKSNFSLDYFYTDNKSNLAGASYKRSTVMGQVDYAF